MGEDEDKLSIKYFSFVIKKLRYLGLGILALNLLIVFSINILFLHMPFGFPLFVVFIPVISFLIFFLINQVHGRFHNNMTHYKYNLLFPFIFHDNPTPKKSDRIDMDEIKRQIKQGDIVLRRYNHYIDGLVFSENSYFTHVGIYCADYRCITSKVLHAEAKTGVHATPLEEFCNCDDIAILRFSFDKTEEEDEMLDHILKEYRPEDDDDKDKIKQRELLVFDNLMKKTKTEKGTLILKKEDVYAEGYSHLILDRAISLLKTPYDFEFNFENFDNLSCIEYVWYCFKFLFPLHRIRVKDFEFFQLIKMPVIVPDVFVRNDFFSYVYTSLPLARKNKKELMKYARSAQKQFWKFIIMILIWDIIFLFGVYFIYCTWQKMH